MNKKVMVLLTLVMILSFALSACQPTATPAASTTKEAAPSTTEGAPKEAGALPDVIKIGVNETMTGWGAPYGDMTWKGITLAHEQVPEVLGKKVELVLVDNKSEKTESAIAAQRLVEVEKVVAVLGVNSSSMAMAQNEVLDKAKYPSVGPACTNPLVTQDKPYAFRVSFIDPFQGWAGAKFATEDPKAKTAVLLVDITLDYPVGLANYFRENFIKMTGNEKSILGYLSFQTGERDFTAQLTQIKKLNPDVVFAPNEYAEEAAILQQARQLGLTPKMKFLAGDSADVPELVQIGKENAEGFFFTAQFHPDAFSNPESKVFVDSYRKKYNLEPETYSVTGYDAYLVLIDAIKRAGSTDPEAIRKALIDTKYVGARGEIQFDKGHNAVLGCPVIEIKDGKKSFRYLAKP